MASLTGFGISESAEAAALVPTEPILRLSVDQYHEMVRAGILNEDAPVELLDGWLVVKMPKNPEHASSTVGTRDQIASILPAGWMARSQEPITLAQSEPEPDVSVVRGDRHRYRSQHPLPADVALVVEVADTTLARDRQVKKTIYADAGIPAYWIVNLIDGQLELYSQPSGSGRQADYRERRTLKPDDQVTLIIEGQEVGRIQVRDLLP